MVSRMVSLLERFRQDWTAHLKAGAILEACRSRLARYKVPRRILRRDELPRTATGKVLKGRLVEDVGKE